LYLHDIIKAENNFDMYRVLGFIVIAFIYCALPLGASAGMQTSIFLDNATMERGYTVVNADRQFQLAIRPNTFAAGAQVSIFNDNDAELALPKHKRKVSNAYTYTVDMDTPHVLSQPLLLDIAYYKDTGNTPSIYYFDTKKDSWKWVPTTRSQNGDRLRAWLPFPSARIIALEDVDQTEESSVSALHAQGAVVIDGESAGILFRKNAEKTHPLASVTKLMSALITLEIQPDWEEKMTISSQDQVGGSSAPLYAGEQVSIRDLFYSMLVPSANNAAHALSRYIAGSNSSFVHRMNKKARELGFTHMRFRDESGLSAGNRATPLEIARLTKTAMAYSEILEATSQGEYDLYSIASNRKTLKNTNRLLQSHANIIAGKTGHTYAAGYNLTVLAITDSGREVIITVVGAPTRQASFADVLYLTQLIQ